MNEDRTQWDILTGDTERDRRNVQILLESVTELYSPRALEEVIQLALDRAIEVTGAQRAILLLAGDDGGLVAQSARKAGGSNLPLDQRYSRSVVDRVWTQGEAQLMVDAEDQSAAALGQSILDLRLLSIMATPLSVKGENLGVLYVDSTVQAKEFTKADFAVFSALGGMIAVAIQNGRLLDERAEKERMQRELDVARGIQQSLFPKDIENPSGYEIAAVGRPCEEVSGDYYDVIPLVDGRVALVVGDVSGHGLGPSIFMAQTRALLHSLLRTHPGPAQVMESLNAFLERDMPVQSFMTLFLAVLDPGARTISYVSAGHNPPLLARNGSVLELKATGPLLGVVAPGNYEVSEPLELANGDVVLLYTDGIFEAHNPRDEIYGEDRLRDSLTKHANAGSDADDVLNGVLADLLTFCEGRPNDDDVTSLVVRVLG